MPRIYVGNLNFSTNEQILKDAFSQYGQVDDVIIITDRHTGRSRGFGFVEMTDDAQAKEAIEGLNGKEVDGRALTVNEARARAPRGGGGRGF